MKRKWEKRERIDVRRRGEERGDKEKQKAKKVEEDR